MILATLLFVVVVGGTVLLSIGGMLLVRRSITLAVLETHNEVAGFLYAVLGVVYAVLLAFTAIVVWEQHTRAESVAAQEASELADLYRNSETFPAEVRTLLRSQIRAYSEAVVEREWPAMARGESSPEAWAAFNRLWHTYQTFRPADSVENAWYAQSIDRLNRLGDDRRDRLLRVGSAVPGVMWAVLLVTGAITIGFTFLFGTRMSGRRPSWSRPYRRPSRRSCSWSGSWIAHSPALLVSNRRRSDSLQPSSTDGDQSSRRWAVRVHLFSPLAFVT